MAQVMRNFFGSTCSVGIETYTTDERMDSGDNGIYIIDGWRIVEHLRTKYDVDWQPAGIETIPAEDEQDVYDFDDMLHALDRSMPEKERLGTFLDSEEMPTSELALGDEVWVRKIDDSLKPCYPVVAFADDDPARSAIRPRQRLVLEPQQPHGIGYRARRLARVASRVLGQNVPAPWTLLNPYQNPDNSPFC